MERKGRNIKETRRKKSPNSIVPNFIAHFQKTFLQYLEDLSTWVPIRVLQWEGMSLGNLSPQFGCYPHFEVWQHESPKATKEVSCRARNLNQQLLCPNHKSILPLTNNTEYFFVKLLSS